MKLTFAKVNPVENMTIFVLDPVDSFNHMNIANKLMDYNSLHGEQVGFVEEPRSLKGKSLNTLRLQMMGGEFCGNASRSLAAYMVYKNHPSIIKSDNHYNVIIEASGSSELLNCEVKSTDKDNIYYSKIKMPTPERVINIDINFEQRQIKLSRVDFSGITHFIVDSNEIEDKESFFLELKKYMHNEEYDAFGIMFYDFKLENLNPLVYVKATDSLYWERSCASGTSALGVALAKEKGDSIERFIRQPGGELRVIVNIDEKNIYEVFLDGEVEIVAEGTVYLNDQP